MERNILSRIIYGNSYSLFFKSGLPVINRASSQSFFEEALRSEIRLLEEKSEEMNVVELNNKKLIFKETAERIETLRGLTGTSFQKFENELLIDLTIPRWFIKQAYPGSDPYLEKLRTKRAPKTNEQINKFLGYYYEGRTGEAMPGFGELKNEYMKDYEILLNAAIFAIAAGEINQAVLSLKHAAMVCHDADALTKARPYWILSRLYYALENFPLALEYAELSLKINSSPRHLYRKSVYLFFNGFTEKAIEALKEIAEDYPGFRLTALIDPDLSVLTPLISPLIDEVITNEQNRLVRLREGIATRLNDPEKAIEGDDRKILEKALAEEKNKEYDTSFRETKRRLERLFAGEKICSLNDDVILLEKEKTEIESKLPELKSRAEKEEGDRGFIYRHLPVKQIKYFIGTWFHTLFYSYVIIVVLGSNLSLILKRFAAGEQVLSPGEVLTMLYFCVGFALIFPLVRWLKNWFLSVEETPDTDTPSMRRYKSLSDDLDICIKRINDLRSQLEVLRKQAAGE